MAHTILMPQAGQSMTEGRIVSWLKKEGESVERGEPLMEIETDKANLEVEALESGVLRKIFVAEGELCPVLVPVGVIGAADEEIDFDALLTAATPAPKSGGQDTKKAPETRSRPTAPRSPAVKSPAGKSSAGKSSAGESPVATTPPPASPGLPRQFRDARGNRILASPLARRLANERGVDLAVVKGSGPGGRVLRRDVEGIGASSTNGGGGGGLPLASTAKTYPPSPRPPARVPIEGMRKAIATALTRSKSSIPHFYSTVSVDVTNALALRAAHAQAGDRISVNDLIVRAVTLALTDEPRVNCRVYEDHIEYPEDVNIGIAVGSDEGLVVPVLLRAQTRNLQEIAHETRQLISSAEAGKLVGSGRGTFTISNLGMFGVESFTAIINPPEGAILAVGAARELLVPAAGGFFPRSILKVTLSCDHRAVDGLLAARFLSRLRWFLETAEL